MIKKISDYYRMRLGKIKIIALNFLVLVMVTGILYGLFNYHASTVYVKNVSSFGEMYKNTIENKIEDYTSESIHLNGDSDILSLDKNRIAKRVEFLKYYHSDYKDIIVADIKGNLYSGYVTNIKEFLYQDYVQTALKGSTTTSKPIDIQGRWYVDFVTPIANEQGVIGVVALRVGLNAFIEDISPKTGNNIEVLIVDSDGNFISGGAGSRRVIGEDSIDINTIKTSIDYSPKTSYKNLDGKSVYGVYYDLNIGGWTMICEIQNDRQNVYGVLLITTLINILLIVIVNKLIGLPCRMTFFKRR
ncbi:MAG: cache domain-containing protein [Clostridium sp.]